MRKRGRRTLAVLLPLSAAAAGVGLGARGGPGDPVAHNCERVALHEPSTTLLLGSADCIPHDTATHRCVANEIVVGVAVCRML